MTFQQAQVHADRMDFGVARYVQHTMQQSSAFGPGDRDVEVSVFADRVLGQQGVAMVTIGVYRIAPVGEIAPHAVGQKLVLRGLRPIVETGRVPLVFTDDFLQEHQVRGSTAYRLTQFRKNEASVERGKPLVGVDRQHPQSMNCRGRVQWHRVDGLRLGIIGHVHSSESGLPMHATETGAGSSVRM